MGRVTILIIYVGVEHTGIQCNSTSGVWESKMYAGAAQTH